MEQDKLAEQLKIENDIISLKRELKNVTAQTSSLKTEYAAIVTLKQNTEKQVVEQKEYLQTVLNDIAKIKLEWLQERSTEMDALAQKNAAADNILKRKTELNEQEETIRQIGKKNQDILNETRTLEFKLGQDKTALEVRERELDEQTKKNNVYHENKQKEMLDFKANVLKLIKSVEKI